MSKKKVILLLIALILSTGGIMLYWYDIIEVLLGIYTGDGGEIASQQSYKDVIFSIYTIVLFFITYKVIKVNQLNFVFKIPFIILSIMWGWFCFKHIIAFGLIG